MPDKKIENVSIGAVIIVLAATITALLSTDDNIWHRIKTLIAGICFGLLLLLILMDISLQPVVKNLVAMVGSAFVSTIWPLLGKISIKYIKKKGDDTIQGNKPY